MTYPPQPWTKKSRRPCRGRGVMGEGEESGRLWGTDNSEQRDDGCCRQPQLFSDLRGSCGYLSALCACNSSSIASVT